MSTLTIAVALLAPSTAAAATPVASAGWHGRAIQDAKPQTRAAGTPGGLPRDWAAGPIRLGTGFHRDGGSLRVRETQRRLWRLGYRPGPVDGLFGPRTQAAVQWFQIKHGLTPDGVVGALTLAALRDRSGGGHQAARGERSGVRAPARPQPGTRNPQPGSPGEGGSRPAGGHSTTSDLWFPVALVLLLLAAPAALALTTMRRRRREPPKTRRPASVREAGPGPAPQRRRAAKPERPPVAASSSQRPPAIGYVSGSGKQVDIARHGGAINRACASRGWALAELVRDDETGSSPLHRPGLAAAMERLAAPGPSRLVVSKLAHLSRSAADLTTLFEWFADHDVQVVAADVAIDTTTPEGRDAASARLTAVAQRQAQAHKNGHTNGSNGNGKPEHAGAANGGHAW